MLAFAGADEKLGRHLGEGMAEDIATELGRFRELDVFAPTTAFAYRDAAVAPERVGRRDWRCYVLEGRLRAFGEGLRLTVRLVETAGARQLWAERYDCARAAIFGVQDDVVCRIVGTVIGRIEDARLEAANRSNRQDLEAYDLWLRG